MIIARAFKVIRCEKHFYGECLVEVLRKKISSGLLVLGSLPHHIFGKRRQIKQGRQIEMPGVPTCRKPTRTTTREIEKKLSAESCEAEKGSTTWNAMRCMLRLACGGFSAMVLQATSATVPALYIDICQHMVPRHYGRVLQATLGCNIQPWGAHPVL